MSIITETTDYKLSDDIYPSIYNALDKLNTIQPISSAKIKDQDDDEEISHTVFFGENIKRVMKVLFK